MVTKILLLAAVSSGCALDNLETSEVTNDLLSANKLAANKLAANKLAANGLSLSSLDTNELAQITANDIKDGVIKVSAGKKRHALVRPKP